MCHSALGLEILKDCPKDSEWAAGRLPEKSARAPEKSCLQLKCFTHLKNRAIPLPVWILRLDFCQGPQAREGSSKSVFPFQGRRMLFIQQLRLLPWHPLAHPTISFRGSMHMQRMSRGGTNEGTNNRERESRWKKGAVSVRGGSSGSF